MTRDVLFATKAKEDLDFWQRTDSKTVQRIIRLIDDACADPRKGIGKPERLRYFTNETWSRRITHRDRLVYEVRDDAILVLQLRDHYSTGE